MKLQIHTYCSYCGEAYQNDDWPRECDNCGNMTFRNPFPVAVLLQPVERGLLLVERAIEPQGLALPGGFIDFGEDWRVAAARELMEETGVQTDPEKIQHFDTISAPDSTLLVFGEAEVLSQADLPAFVKNSETHGIQIAESMPDNLVFDLHEAVARRWFEAREK